MGLSQLSVEFLRVVLKPAGTMFPGLIEILPHPLELGRAKLELRSFLREHRSIPIEPTGPPMTLDPPLAVSAADRTRRD